MSEGKFPLQLRHLQSHPQNSRFLKIYPQHIGVRSKFNSRTRRKALTGSGGRFTVLVALVAGEQVIHRQPTGHIPSARRARGTGSEGWRCPENGQCPVESIHRIGGGLRREKPFNEGFRCRPIVRVGKGSLKRPAGKIPAYWDKKNAD